MPTDSLLVSVCVVAMFVVFGAVLYWGDLQTRSKDGADSSTASAAPSDRAEPGAGSSAGQARLTGCHSDEPDPLDARQYAGRLSALLVALAPVWFRFDHVRR